MPTTSIASGDSVYARGDLYEGPATVRAVENNGTNDVIVRTRTPEGRKFRYRLADLVNGVLLRGRAPGNGAVEAAPAPAAPSEPEVALEDFDIVNVNGSLYNGEAMVLRVWEEPSGTSRNRGVRDRADQPYPQVEVRGTDGKDRHYNGDDIAAGKIAFVRKPSSSDFDSYRNGTTKAIPTPDGLHSLVAYDG